MTKPLHGQNILLIGCGNMGNAMLQGWLKAGIAAEQITVVEPQPVPVNGIKHVAQASELPKQYMADIAVIAIKPQAMAEVLLTYAAHVDKATLLLSIAAGTTIAKLQALLPQPAIIRAMPNLPATIGLGVTAMVADNRITDAHRQKAETLMQAIGSTVWLEDEALMDAVTAVSGSGPAFIFYFMECIVSAAMQLGLPEETALQLVKQTLVGSAHLAADATDSLAILRQRVTSRGGTTEAGLQVLMTEDAVKKIIQHTLAAAAERSKTLSL